MSKKKENNKFIFSVGGSLVVPDGGINIAFLSKFNIFIRQLLQKQKDQQLFLVVGGGATARHYRDAGKNVIGKDLAADDLDWLGIHATRLNAHLVRTIFRDIAHPAIIKDYDELPEIQEGIIIAAGWKPGWSTDYDCVLLCERYGVDTVVNLSNIDMVYDKDPTKFSDARPIRQMTWKEYRKLIGGKWIPGMHAPFDPVASKKAEGLKLKVVILRGDNFGNLRKFFNGEKFIGTVIL